MIAILLAASPATAQAQARPVPIEQRIERVERELRAVQRRVFPEGRAQFVEPEIGAPQGSTPAGTGSALSSLAARVEAIESQLRALTGAVEEQGERSRRLEADIGRLRTEIDGRIDRLEGPRPAASAPSTPVQSSSPAPAPAEPEPDAPAVGGSDGAAEEAYNAGFRLWDARRFTEAQTALDAAATRYPSSRWASWMRNLQGRAFLDDSKPASAARILLANYQNNPRGERAADSLFFLGQSLARLNRRAEACRVYAELADVYPNMRAFLRERLPQARSDARCSSPS